MARRDLHADGLSLSTAQHGRLALLRIGSMNENLPSFWDQKQRRTTSCLAALGRFSRQDAGTRWADKDAILYLNSPQAFHPSRRNMPTA